MRRSISLLFIAALLGSPRMAGAQELAVTAVHLDADHELLGATAGFGLSVGFQLSPRIGLRVGYQRTGGTFAAVGSTCQGLISPEEDCAVEARRDRARVQSVTLSAPLTLAHAGRLSLAVVPGLQWANVVSEQRGERSGRTRRATKANPGVDLGLELSLEPVVDGPFAVVLSGGQSLLDPLRTEHIADGYTPFEERIGLTRATLGIVLRR